MQSSSNRPSDWNLRNLALIFILTVYAFLIMGYHPGLEDDAFYLAAIKRDLNSSLFPHDSEFFIIQFQATIFDKLIALSVRLTHLPLAWIALLWQFAAIFFILHASWRIARRCFSDPPAQWSAVTMIAALLTIPVSGTAIDLADQYLHPRNLATAAVLFAVVAVLDRKPWLASLWLAIAFALHAIMAGFGISFCLFLFFALRNPHLKLPSSVVAALIPLGWIFEPTSDAWRKAASTRTFYDLLDWAWYEWLGIFAPLALLYAFQTFLRRREKLWVAQRFERCDPSAQNEGALAPEVLPFVSALLYYGVFQTIIGLALMLPSSLQRLRPFEPMRYLHLLYLFFFLLAGALLGRYVLRRHAYRWALLFIPLTAGMFYAQRQMYPASAHIEFPGTHSNNPWLQAFAWIRNNTPTDAYFALDPHYMQLPGEDYHGFRALAERSVLADLDKDAGMAARVPRLAPRWLKEVSAQQRWRTFGAADFERLKNDFGVTWFVFSRLDEQFSDKQPSHFWCWYQDEDVKVCHLGETTKRPPFIGLDESEASRGPKR